MKATHRPLHLSTLILASTLAAPSLVACGDEATAPVSDEEYDDVAQSVAGLAFEEGGALESARDASELAIGNGWLRSDQSGGFTGERGELTYQYDIECLSALGTVVDPCDVRTRTATVGVRIEGELETTRRSATLLWLGSWDVALQGADSVLIDGASSTDLATTFEAFRRPDVRSYVLASDAEYIGLELDLSTQRFVAGRIELSIQADRTRTGRFNEVEASIEVDAVIELSPNGPAIIELDGSRSYEVDPITAEITTVE